MPIRELPEATWDLKDPCTTLQEGLMVAEWLIVPHPCMSPQILIIANGQPIAYFMRGQLYVE